MASGDCWLNMTGVHENSKRSGGEKLQRENFVVLKERL